MLLPILSLAASVVVSATPTVTYAPSLCPYTVEFPSTPSHLERSSADGSKMASAELVIGDARFSVFCAIVPAPSPSRVLTQAERNARIAGLVNALQIGEAQINDAGADGCSNVDGRLQADGNSYTIVARLCFRSDLTFIAETIFGSGKNAPAAREFLASVHLHDAGQATGTGR